MSLFGSARRPDRRRERDEASPRNPAASNGQHGRAEYLDEDEQASDAGSGEGDRSDRNTSPESDRAGHRGRAAGAGREQDREHDEDADAAPRRRPKLTGSQAVRRASEFLADLTGQAPENVAGLSATGEGGWKVTLDVAELRRVPPTTDVIGSYELELDGDGELLGYRRIARFYRNQVDQD